jgi:hypothetical protein
MKEQSTDTSKQAATAMVKKPRLVLCELVPANAVPIDPNATIRIKDLSGGCGDIAAEKHASNISKALAKSTGRIAYRIGCMAAGFPDPEAK